MPAEDLSDMNVKELRDLASDMDIEGRSDMNKEELVEAIEADPSYEAERSDDFDNSPEGKVAAAREELRQARVAHNSALQASRQGGPVDPEPTHKRVEEAEKAYTDAREAAS